ncbi:MAG: alkaline phytoceramidase [Betaproteobacteria bacterium]
MRHAAGLRWLAAFTVLCLLAALLLPALPQPPDYHGFADQRRLFGIDNFLNVASNAGFLVIGAVGLVITLGGRARFEHASERWPYALFFAGLLLTALGSGWYHLAPDNERLFWDRLPMTIAFAGLISSQLVDRIGVRAGLVSLPLLVVAGVAAVIYWLGTERAGAGNVMPYAILQGYAVVVLLLLAILAPSRYTRGNDVYWVFAWYLLSKVLEAEDAPVMAAVGIVSGHTLKHIAAAAAGLVACGMLMRRRLVAKAETGALD